MNMMRRMSAWILAALLAAPAAAQGSEEAQGDPDAGATQFDRQCVACHVIADPDGEVLAGRNARTGPNLYGVVGREPASVEDFRYGASLTAYGETGVVWEEENIVGYLQDPTGHLRDALDDPRARSSMAYQVRDEADAYDIHAFLATFAADDGADDGADEDADDASADQ